MFNYFTTIVYGHFTYTTELEGNARAGLLRAAVERNREKWTAHAYILRQLVEAQGRIEARLKVLEGGGKS